VPEACSSDFWTGPGEMGCQRAVPKRQPSESTGISGDYEAAREVNGLGFATRWPFEPRLSNTAEEVRPHDKCPQDRPD
jgi:hypothetical protein